MQSAIEFAMRAGIPAEQIINAEATAAGFSGKGEIICGALVTGLSGAGRSTALRRLEDMGYFCG
ncbi:MAG: RNase adapter RapZ [Christensenellales bacterium]